MASPTATVPPSVAACQKACAGGNPYARGGARSEFVDRIVGENSFQAREPAARLFGKIARNIIDQPQEEKFRKLNMEKVMSKFTGFVGIAELLRSVGFVASSDGANLILPASASLDPLCQALCAWEERESRALAARQEAERIRAENLREAEADRARKEANRAHIKSLGAQARAEVASKPINESRGNQIKFGSTLAKVPQPAPATKGG